MHVLSDRDCSISLATRPLLVNLPLTGSGHLSISTPSLRMPEKAREPDEKKAMNLQMSSESSPPNIEALPIPQPRPAQSLFKRNPPIAGESEAIEAAKEGDPEAFSKLYALHKRRVYTLCLRILGNVSDAEDMPQEAFQHLFRNIRTFRGDSAFSTWLHRLTLHLALMHLRKKGLNLVSLEETINPSAED